MNSRLRPRRSTAFTLVELLVVMAIIGILAALLLPVVAKAPGRVRRVVCASNLRQQGIAFHTFAHDHRDRFPQSVPMAEGGALELNARSPSIGGKLVINPHAFRALSNELGSVRILVCPSSPQVRAIDFPRLGYSNVSYFVGLDASMQDPQSPLAGDRNMWASTNRGVITAPVAAALPGQFEWTPDRHGAGGNVLAADGSVAFLKKLALTPRARPGVVSPTASRPTPAAARASTSVAAPTPAVVPVPSSPTGAAGDLRQAPAQRVETTPPISAAIAPNAAASAVSTIQGGPPVLATNWVEMPAEGAMGPGGDPRKSAARENSGRWAWWLIAALVLLVAYLWWRRRQRASERDADTSSVGEG